MRRADDDDAAGGGGAPDARVPFPARGLVLVAMIVLAATAAARALEAWGA